MESLIHKLHDIGAVKFGSFVLKSGVTSPVYIDLRLIVSYPQILAEVADAIWSKVSELPFDIICGVPYTALPIATAVSLKYQTPMVMRRKEVKEYGTKKAIEGKFEKGQTCLIIEDIITSGISIFETITPLEEEGLKIKDVIVLIDREQGGSQKLTEKGYRLHSIFSLNQILETVNP